MGEDEGLTEQEIKDAHQYLDRFINEIAYKARFESHFVEFKKDILKHINDLQTGIQELGKNKPYLLVDHLSLWTPMIDKFENDRKQITNSIEK